MQCTRCGKELKDLKIDISLSVFVERIKENDVLEQVPNSDTTSREVLCIDCFNELADVLSQMNVKYKGREI